MRLLLAALAVTTALAGCGGGDDGAPAQQSPLAAVQAAAATTAEVGSSKFALASTTMAGGQRADVTATGAFDYAKETGTLSLKVPTGGTIEQRIVGGTIYLTLPGQADVFYAVAVKDLAGTSLASSTDPSAQLQALKGATDVTEVGTEDVRGAATTHYRGTYDVAKALAETTGAVKEQLTATLGQTDLTSVPFDVFIDDEGRMRKFVQSITVDVQGQKAESETTVELFDFGTAVDVVAPPAAQVKDGAPLLKALKEQTG